MYPRQSEVSAVQNRPGPTSPGPGNRPPLDMTADHIKENLVRAHAMIDRIEAGLFGPAPQGPKSTSELPQPLGLVDKLDSAAGASHSLADRLHRIVELLTIQS